MAESYQIIKKPTEGFYKEKGSKFLGFAYQVNSLEQINENLDRLKKEYHDARHHCYAYIVGLGTQPLVRANDDGEPNHSAGDPILGQIRSFGLTNTLVIVVRYFGGTKLGVSGLINAYKTAAEEALRKAQIEVVEIKQEFSLEYPYDKTNEVMRMISDFEIEIKNQEFLEICSLVGRIEPELFDALKDKMDILKISVQKL